MRSRPDDPIWERIRLRAATIDRGGEGRVVRDPAEVLAAYRYGDRVIRSLNRRGRPPRFDEFDALPPGALDVRVFDQATWWVDARGAHHLIDDADAAAKPSVMLLIARLLDEAPVHHLAYTLAFPARTVAADSHVWLVDTVLLMALLERVENDCPEIE